MNFMKMTLGDCSMEVFIGWFVEIAQYHHSTLVLISFPLTEEEEVREIPLPRGLHVIENYVISVFRECLCLGGEINQEFWVMKEYGVRESWTQNKDLHLLYVMDCCIQVSGGKVMICS